MIAHLVFTLSDSAPPGSSIAITLDPSVTLLSDEGGNTSESPANGTLVLVDGAINIPSSMVTTPTASMANMPAETVRPARFLNNAKVATSSTRFSPRTSSYLGTTNHDALFGYDEAGDVLHDDQGRTFTYDALSMTTGATASFTNGGGIRTFAYIYTADDERIALVETLPSSATTTTWTLRGLDNHLLRSWTNSSWREDDIWRGAALLAYESPTGVCHHGLDHLGSPAIITDALGHSVGPLTFDAFGNGGATGAGMLEYTGQERDSYNVGSSPGPVTLPDYIHARYYDSARGRFLSMDPLLGNPHRPQTWNRYVYTENNPILLTDPTGACPTCILESLFEVAGNELADELANSAAQAGLGAYVVWSSSEDIPKADPNGKPTGDEAPPLLGSSGTKVDSKTLWPPKDRQNEDGTRVDVENHPESKRPGQVQVQRGEGKTKETYTVQRAFDPSTGRWGYRIAEGKTGAPAPGWVKNLLKDAEVRDAILKGMQKYLGESDFTFSRIYRW